MADPTELLRHAHRIAVVGMSEAPGKAATDVPRDLIAAGFDVVPVNPLRATVQGHPSRQSLADVEGPIDIVDVFRPAAEAAAITEQAIACGARAVWLQLGIRSDAARALAEAAGIAYVEDTCIMVVRRRAGITCVG